MAISQRTGVPPSRILFIGDSFEKDVMGATAAGMTGGLLIRSDFTSKEVIRQETIISGDLTNEISAEMIQVESVTSALDSEKINNGEKYIIFNNLYPEEVDFKINRFFKNK